MKLAKWAFLLILVAGSAVAGDINIVGTIDQPVSSPQASNLLRAPSMVRQVTLLKMELSDKARQKIMSRTIRAANQNNAQFPNKIQLEMGNVPVLDQGRHGSCVAFAVTGAVDAALNKGDYVSQLCLLQLGHYLEKTGYTPSGWEGSYGQIVLSQLGMFGLVNKEQQRASGCGGLTEYPLQEAEPNTDMSPAEYHQLSEPMDGGVVAWSSVLDEYQVISDKADMNEAMNAVKAALNAGDRLTFGVLIVDVYQGMAGAIGRYHATNDSWVLTPELANDINSETEFAGHEMIITGYDDEAVAFDTHGRPHKGLFTLRNSWGRNLGDRGNFYMSYDYFKMLVVEIQRIRGLSH